MFSLIITIISVALVVALVAATLYHGGDTVTKGRAEAEIAQSLNELSQIKGALQAYNASEGKDATSINELVPKYLKSVPSGWGVEVPSQVAFESTRLLKGSEEEKLSSCTEINKRLGKPDPTPPLCTEITAGFEGCCTAAE